MSKFDEAFEKYQYTDKVEKSIREFSNWLFGIAIGINALLLFKIREFSFIGKMETYYLSIVIISLVNTIFNGYCKYYILKRDTALSIEYSTLRKITLFGEMHKKPAKEIEDEWNKTFECWIEQFNKIRQMGHLLNISIVTATITILLTGLFIIITFLFN